MSHHEKSNELIHTMEKWFHKAPALPKNAIDALVKVMPYIALIFGILGILGAISSFGLLGATSPFAVIAGPEGVASYGVGFVAVLFWLASSALLLAAFPGLKAHKIGGWNLLFWSELVSVIGSVISFSLGGIIGAVIGFYILFQIKSHYK